MPTRLVDNNEDTFIVNEDDEYYFAASDIFDKIAKSSNCRKLFTKEPSSEDQF